MPPRSSALFAVILTACSGEAIVDGSATHASVASTSASTGGTGGTNLGIGGSPADPCLAECGSVSEPSGCLECALQGDECEEEYALCLQDPTCLAYEQCSQSCNDVACTQRCNETYPDGAATYGALFYCLNCAPTRVRCSVPCMNALCTLP